MIEIARRIEPGMGAGSLERDIAGAFGYAVSAATYRIIGYQADTLRGKPTPASYQAADAEKQLAERVFDALASVKILTAQVAMHLDREWRDKIFQQLDSLHAVDEWEAGDEPIQQASFVTFLKAILALRSQRRPGLGLSQAGNLIAAWTTNRDRLTIEFLPNDRVGWVLTRYIDDEPERVAGQMNVSRLTERLAPYHPEHWFSHEGRQGQKSPG